MTMHANCHSSGRLRCLLEEIETATSRMKLLLLMSIHLANCLLRACIITLKMEAIPLWHVLYSSWRVAWRDSDGIARLIHLGIMAAIIHVLSSDITSHLVIWDSLLHGPLVLIREVIVMGHRKGWLR